MHHSWNWLQLGFVPLCVSFHVHTTIYSGHFHPSSLSTMFHNFYNSLLYCISIKTFSIPFFHITSFPYSTEYGNIQYDLPFFFVASHIPQNISLFFLHFQTSSQITFERSKEPYRCHFQSLPPLKQSKYFGTLILSNHIWGRLPSWILKIWTREVNRQVQKSNMNRVRTSRYLLFVRSFSTLRWLYVRSAIIPHLYRCNLLGDHMRSNRETMTMKLSGNYQTTGLQKRQGRKRTSRTHKDTLSILPPITTTTFPYKVMV